MVAPSGLQPEERRQEEEDAYFGGSRRYQDKRSGMTTVNVHAGDCFVTEKDDEKAITVLGSCIAACIRDPVAHVGGMNHFMLPGVHNTTGNSARYGAYAMEKLINEIIKRGGVKRRFEVKVFGGGNVIDSSSNIGQKNCVFVTEYLKNESLPIVSQDLGGTWPRRVHYHVGTGQVFVRKLQRSTDLDNVRREEESYRQSVDTTATAPQDDIELF